MLVKLSDPVTDTPLVGLNFDPAVPSSNEPLTVIGFGNTAEDGTFSTALLEVGVETISFADCNNYFGTINDELMLCAGTEQGGRDSCQGDSGE